MLHYLLALVLAFPLPPGSIPKRPGPVPQPKAADVPSMPAPSDLSPKQQKFLDLINAYRTQQKMHTLKWDQSLADSAHKNNMAGGHHTIVPRGVSQNWAWNGNGNITAEQAFTMWRHSSGHNRNMLSNNHRCGIAFDRGHATLNLAR